MFIPFLVILVIIKSYNVRVYIMYPLCNKIRFISVTIPSYNSLYVMPRKQLSESLKGRARDKNGADAKRLRGELSCAECRR